MKIKELKTDYWKLIFNWVEEQKDKDINFLLRDDCTMFAYNALISQKFTLSKMNFFACARHLLFLYKSAHDDTFPFIYKKMPLRRLVKFSEFIIVPEINKQFIFPPFRKFMAGFVFGWRYKNDIEKLMTTEVFDIEARKQWKSSFWAMIMLATMCGFNFDLYPEIYISGPQRENSRIPYTIAQNYLFKSPRLQPFFSTFNSLHIKGANGGIMKHLPFEKSAIEGKNSTFVLLTEYHLHSNDDMQESASTSRNTSRKNLLIVYDTTKGHNTDSVCFARESNYKKFLNNQINKPEELNINFDVFLWAAELDDDDYENWRDPKLWIKANPNLGVSVTLAQLKSEFNKILDRKSEVEFKTKRVGMWAGQATSHFELFQLLESDRVASAQIKSYLDDPTKLRKLTAILGIDLSAIHDTTHGVINFEIPQPDGESIWLFIGMGFVPEDNIHSKELNDRAQYLDWRDKGYCTLTPGKLVDYDYLQNWIKDQNEIYNIDKVGYDPWGFKLIKRYLLNTNAFLEEDVVPIKQGVYLSPIFKEFERKLLLKKVAFSGNKMLIRHLTNVAVIETKGTSDNLIIKKVSGGSRIDGFMAMLFAASLQVDNVNQPAMTKIKILGD